MDYEKEMIRQMELKNFSKGTHGTYLSTVRQLCKYFGKLPSDITTKQVEDYILQLQNDSHYSKATVEGHINAIKFLVNKTLKRKDREYSYGERSQTTFRAF